MSDQPWAPAARFNTGALRWLDDGATGPGGDESTVLWTDGTTVHPTEPVLWTDGVTVYPATVTGWWDGTTIQPVG